MLRSQGSVEVERAPSPGSPSDARGSQSIVAPWGRVKKPLDATSAIRTKIETLVSIADSTGSSIGSDELLLLLPSGSFSSAAELEEFVSSDPELMEKLFVYKGAIALVGSEQFARKQAERAELTVQRISLARRFSARLATIAPWVRLVAITGSTAYQGTKPLDDLDFFIVTEKNRLWITLLFALMLAKTQGTKDRGLPVHCINRLLEERECEDAFRLPQGPLFAREALSMQVLAGHDYYRNLIRSAPWMARIFPGLYQRNAGAKPERDTDRPDRKDRPAWLLNWVALFTLAPYLVLIGAWRNTRLQKSRNLDARFNTRIQRRFFAYESRRYEILMEAYRKAF